MGSLVPLRHPPLNLSRESKRQKPELPRVKPSAAQHDPVKHTVQAFQGSYHDTVYCGEQTLREETTFQSSLPARGQAGYTGGALVLGTHKMEQRLAI
jgi:hypothetical protein